MVWDLKESLIVSRLTISIDMHGCLLMTDKQPGIHRKNSRCFNMFNCMAVGSTKTQHHSFVKDMTWDIFTTKKTSGKKKPIRFCRVNLEPTGIHAVGTWRSRINAITSWWFQPIWRILVKLGIFPKVRGENTKYLKPTPRSPKKLHTLSFLHHLDW